MSTATNVSSSEAVRFHRKVGRVEGQRKEGFLGVGQYACAERRERPEPRGRPEPSEPIPSYPNLPPTFRPSHLPVKSGSVSGLKVSEPPSRHSTSMCFSTKPTRQLPTRTVSVPRPETTQLSTRADPLPRLR